MQHLNLNISKPSIWQPGSVGPFLSLVLPPLLLQFIPCATQIFMLLGFHEFLPSSEVMSKLEGQLCKFQPALCVSLLAAICGYNPSNLDLTRLSVYLNYTPSGTSVKNMVHWSQVEGVGSGAGGWGGWGSGA
jgi:hypothetical protein